MRAVIVGATGATGRELVAQLLLDPATWASVTTVGRRRVTELPPAYSGCVSLSAAEDDARLLQQARPRVPHGSSGAPPAPAQPLALPQEVDMNALEQQATAFAGADAVFCTLGTTRDAAGSAAAYRHVDLELVDKAASAASAASVPQFLLLTARGANALIPYGDLKLLHGLLYLHLKGAAEEAAAARHFPHLSVFRPGMLDRGLPPRSLAERLAYKLLPTTAVADVARAMIAAAKRNAGAPPAPTAVYEL